MLPRELSKWPIEWLTEQQEREAIMIEDGRVPPEDARRLSIAEIRRRADGPRLW